MESKLIAESISGDVASFEKLIEQYNRYVYNIAYRMMGNEEDAKDMAQEALIKAYKHIKTFKQESNFSTWLYRIVINACKDELRKRQASAISLDAEIGENSRVGDVIEDKNHSVNPVIVYEQLELRNEIQSALDTLSEDAKIVVVLKDIMGYSYQEIGEILEIPIGTVRSRLNRSRQSLKAQLSLQLSDI
ncbi:RNA polymerase sigma factor [Fusibacter sp. JL298sf-3]